MSESLKSALRGNTFPWQRTLRAINTFVCIFFSFSFDTCLTILTSTKKSEPAVSGTRNDWIISGGSDNYLTITASRRLSNRGQASGQRYISS